MKKPSSVLLLHESLAGHRPDYLKLFGTIFEQAGLAVERRGIAASDILRKEPLFSTMLEEHPLRFSLIAGLRGLIGRRSATLIFRPAEAAQGRSARLRLKRLTLAALKRLPGVSVISIIPFGANEELGKVANDWIYDPQFWDLDPRQSLPASPIDLAARAGGRCIVCALGSQNEGKGFKFFCDLWMERPEMRENFLFVAAGKVAGDLSGSAARFVEAGGVLLDRFISDEELLGLYGAANIIWCCYAPHYNQASGIFGRSIQLGRAPIVRDGSLLEEIAGDLQIPVIALPWRLDIAARVLLDTRVHRTPPVDVEDMRRVSIAKLTHALGI